MDDAPSVALQWLNASGYCSIFLMPALLVASLATGHSCLAIGVAFLVLPLTRLVFGAYRPVHRFAWSESVATFLHALPAVYLIVALGSLVYVASGTSSSSGLPAASLVGIGLSLWITLLLGLCPAHELLHRRSPANRLLGAVLAGAVGYPALALEHAMHHAREGDTQMAEWPLLDESVWRFATRRLRQIGAEFADALRPNKVGSAVGTLQVQARVAAASLALVASCFLALGGGRGLLVYVCAAAGCTLGMQIMTYLQHWGLAEPSSTLERPQPLAWENDCRFQAWITLHISFHQEHHRVGSAHFYRIGMSDESPRLPAGYIIMMLLCLVPRLWRRAMWPALAAWQANPLDHRPAGRRLTCFGLYQGPKEVARP